MKKFFALLMALVMVFSMSSVAFALGANKVNESTGLGAEDGEVKVTVQENADDTIYYVEITWGTLEFTYDMSATKWDPTTHTYRESDGTGWATNDNPKITVINHSNAGVAVTADFDDGNNDKQATNFDVTATLTNADVTLESADVTARYNNVGNAASTTYTVSVSGVPNTAWTSTNNVVGTIVVIINPVA